MADETRLQPALDEPSPPEPVTIESPVDSLAPPSRRRATIINLAYQLASVLTTVVRGVVMIPIFLRYMSLDLYAAWMVTGAVLTWIALAEAGSYVLLRQHTAQAYGRKDREALSRDIGTGLFVLLGTCVVAVAIGRC